MSFQITNAVWECSAVAGSARLLLLAIADYADEEGVAWPGVRTLARRTLLSERRVQQLLRQLQSEGQIERVPNPGRGRFDCYRILCTAGDRVEGLGDRGPNDRDQGLGDRGLGDRGLGDRGLGETSGQEVQESARRMKASAETVRMLPRRRVKPSAKRVQRTRDGVKSAGERVQTSGEGAKAAAERGESAPHTHEDPPLIPNENPLQNRARVETPQQRFFRVVAWVLGWEVTALSEAQRGAVAQTVSHLSRSGYDEQDVRRFWREIWLHDWRWTRRHEHPKPTQLRSEIFRLRALATLAADSAHAAPSEGATTSPTQDELDLIEKMKEANKRDKLNTDRPIRERLDLSNLQRPGVGAAHG